MITPQKIADVLSRVKKIVDKKGVSIIQSSEIKRSDRELLLQTKWLQEIIKGWYLLIRPDLASGDSSAWYANFWDFLRLYLKKRFNNNYCLSAENSLELHVDTPIIPNQVIIISKSGGSSTHPLPYNTSILIYSDPKNIPKEKTQKKGLQVMPLELAICKVSPIYFKNNPQEAEIALRLIKSPDKISKIIIENNFKRTAGRLVGAYKFLGEPKIAKKIETDLNLAGIKVNIENPFEQTKPLLTNSIIQSPYYARIKSIWAESRNDIIKIFPKPKGLPKNIEQYLSYIDDIYEFDAYNSLSIEGYKVTQELIERVKNNNWNPDLNLEDQEERNALAARGYFEAFKIVKKSVLKILQGKNPGIVLENDLQIWYQNLFAPIMRTGILSASQLIGYRNNQVYIRGSRHVPPNKEALIDAMDALFSCIKSESHPGVRAVLGHYLFVFIHPYMDGNGRIARFLMNAMFASGGYSWTVIENSRRKNYLDTLKIIDEQHDIKPFTEFIIEEMIKSEQYIKVHK